MSACEYRDYWVAEFVGLFSIALTFVLVFMAGAINADGFLAVQQ